MGKDVKIGSAYFDVHAKKDQIARDMQEVKQYANSQLKNVEASLSKIKPNIQTHLLKKSVSELQTMHAALKKQLEMKVALNADYSSIQRTKIALDTVGQALKEVTIESKNATEGMSRWGMVATGIKSAIDTVTGFAAGMKDLVGESVMTAAKLEGIERAFKRLDQPGLLDNLRTATKGTVSDLSLMQAAVRADKFKISLDQLGNLLQFAQRTAQETGQSVDYLVESIIMGIGRKSPQILDNLGISAIALKAKFGDVGVEAATIADVTKAVGSIAQEEMAKMGEVVSTTADKYARMGRDVDDAKTRLGALINEGLKPLIDAYDKSGKGMKDFVSRMVAVTGIIIKAIPLVTQIIIAKKMLGIQAATAAASITAETIAIEANTVAMAKGMGILSRFIGALGMIGATAAGIGAVGAVVWTLAENIKSLDDRKVKSTAEALDQLIKDYGTAKSLGLTADLRASTPGIQSGDIKQSQLIRTSQLKNTGSGLISPHLMKQTTDENKKDNEQWSIKGKTVKQIKDHLADLQKTQEMLVYSSAEYWKNFDEIEALTKRMSQGRPLPYTKPNEVNAKGLEQSGDNTKIGGMDFNRNDLITKKALSTQKMPENPVLKEVNKDLEDGQAVAQRWADILGDSFMSVVTGSQSVGEALGALVSQLGAMIVKALIFKAIWAAITSGASEGAAAAAGSSYFVPSIIGTSGPAVSLPSSASQSTVNFSSTNISSSSSFSDKNIVASIQALSDRVNALASRPIINNQYLDGKLIAQNTTQHQNGFSRRNMKFGS